jgi:hypothetical protein
MDSGNISETKDEAIQPEEVVVTESEATEAEPHAAATEETEFYVEEEGDQQEEPKGGMSDSQQKAAFKEERAKRKKKNEELKAAQEREEALQRRIEELERKTAPAKPNPADFIDATEYQEAVDKYNGAKAPAKQQQVQGITLSDDQAFHAHKTREALRSALPDYDEAEGNVKKFIASKVENPEAAINGLIAMTHAHEVDYAKAMFALNKFPKLQEELAAAPNDNAILSVMKKAAKKVKTRQATKIDTKPEPELKSSGAVNIGSTEIDNARKAYQADSSVANFKKLAALKKQYK